MNTETVPFVDIYAASEPLAADPPPAPSNRVRPIPWQQFCTELLETQYHSSMRSRRTRYGIERVLKLLAELGATTTADLDSGLVGRFIAHRSKGGVSPNTVRGELGRISAVCGYAQELGRIHVSPFLTRKVSRWVREVPPLPRNERHLTREELRRIKKVLDTDVAERLGMAQWRARRTQALILTYMYTGLRRNEGIFLKVCDVDLAAGLIWVVDRDDHALKTASSAQPVPIPDSLAPVLASWLSYRDSAPPGVTRPPSEFVFRSWGTRCAWSGGSKGTAIRDRIKAIARRAGISSPETVSPQTFRRSLATHLESHGSGSMAQRILRHTSSRTTKRYYQKVDIANITAAMKDFDF